MGSSGTHEISLSQPRKATLVNVAAADTLARECCSHLRALNRAAVVRSDFWRRFGIEGGRAASATTAFTQGSQSSCPRFPSSPSDHAPVTEESPLGCSCPHAEPDGGRQAPCRAGGLLEQLITLLYPTATRSDPPPAGDELQVGHCHMQTILLLTGEGKAWALPQTSKSRKALQKSCWSAGPCQAERSQPQSPR